MSIRRSSRTASKATVEDAKPPIAVVKEPTKKSTKRAIATSEASPFKIPSVPQTPPNKRRKKPVDDSPIPPPTSTPTPSAIGLMSDPMTPNPRRKPASTRRAAPHATNAPLQTPQGTRLVKYPTDLFESSASQDAGVNTTTDNLLAKACAHICEVDPKLEGLIEKHHCKMFSPEGLAEEVEPFTALSSGIIAQQVSGAAASSIKRKFVSLFFVSGSSDDNRRFPTPAQVVEKDIPTLRTAGLSQRKAEYIHGLAEKFNSGELSAQMLIEASDEEVLEKLIAVRGLGRWSVEMFACFGLKRTDIFSTGDLGIQKGMAAYMGRDVAKLRNKGGKWKYMSETEMLKIAEPFAPYRSLFMWYMWRVADTNTDAIAIT